MRGLDAIVRPRVIVRGHTLMQNFRHGHYELGVDTHAHRRVATAFTELAARPDLNANGSSSVPTRQVPLNATVPTEQPPAKRNPAIAR